MFHTNEKIWFSPYERPIAQYGIYKSGENQDALYAETDNIVEAIEKLNSCIDDILDTEYGVMPEDWPRTDVVKMIGYPSSSMDLSPHIWLLMHNGQRPLCYIQNRGILAHQ